MPEARANYVEVAPVLNGITVTLTVDEAKQLKRFIGRTSLETVNDLMHNPYDANQVNDTLYYLYEALNRLDELDTGWDY